MSNPERNTSRVIVSEARSMAAEEMRNLVLEYLNHHCYYSTADALANSMAREVPEVVLDADGDEVMRTADDKLLQRSALGDALVENLEVRNVEVLRAVIREQILNGDLTRAREELIEHFPSVLAPTLLLSTSAHPETFHTANARINASPISIEPQHISLNLHIQEFIESVRTIPLSRSLSPSLDASSSTLRDSPVPDHLKLLKRAQQLSVIASNLPSESDRVIYHKELENVCALLAYLVPEKSLVSRYMTMQRREAVAEQVNRAILFNTHRSPIPDLQRYAEHATVVYSVLNELAVPCSLSSLPAGVQSVASSETTSTLAKPTSTKSHLPSMIVSPFDLASFASTRP